MTAHRYHAAPARLAGQAIACSAALVVLAASTTPVYAAATGLVVAAVAVPLRQQHGRRLRERNDRPWPPDLPPLPDLDRPLAEVLAPPLPRTVVFAATTTEDPHMTAATLPRPEMLPALPADFAAELARTQSGPLPVEPPARWLLLAEMRPGDRFELESGAVVALRTCNAHEEYAWSGLLVVTVEADRQGDLPMITLPANRRWRMVRALRHAAVRCMVCDEVTGDLADHTYDLAAMDSHVAAVCESCERATTRAAS